MNGFNWPVLMTAGIRGLGMKPREFWALTPAELIMMLGEIRAEAPLNRSRLAELVRAFPDDEQEGET